MFSSLNASSAKVLLLKILARKRKKKKLIERKVYKAEAILKSGGKHDANTNPDSKPGRLM